MTPGSKRRIEAAAADLLSRSGYHGMGVKSLTEVTGLPAGSIYHHFPGGKEEIAVAAIVWTSGLVRSMIEVVVADGVDAHAVRVLFAFMADRLEASAWTEGCVIGTPALDGSAASRPVGEACRVGYAAMVDPIAAALRREGWSRVAAHDLATTIVATYEGAAAMARVQRSRAPLVAAGEAMIRLLDHDRG